MALISPSPLRTSALFARAHRTRPVSALGHNVALARETLELSAAQLAAATSGVVSARRIIALETGRSSDVRVAELIALCRALEVLPHELCAEFDDYYR